MHRHISMQKSLNMLNYQYKMSIETKRNQIKQGIIMKNVYFFVVLSIFLSLSTRAHAAGTPTIFSYQGRLSDSSGNLLGGSGTTYYFKFSIWNVSTGGTSGVNRLWPASDPTYVSATVRQGVFNTDIDISGYNPNTSSNIYLRVDVSSTTSDSDFQELSPRQRISSSVFSQISGAVSGTGQSSFGTTTPFSKSVVSVEATSTNTIALTLRSILGQIANIFQIQDSNGANLFSINSIGSVFASSTLNVSGVTTQFKLGQVGSIPAEFYVDPSNDLHISSDGGNIREDDQNLWVCEGGSGCGVESSPPTGTGNIIVENGVMFGNKFDLKLKANPGATTTTIMQDSLGNEVLEFDEGR
jgi:hypothetical protein